ncbi:MAG: hypothetical protein HEQ25_06330 [Dolichospermum sp. DET73]|nr:hypothetical protein [Dolichospermum sp. DET73]
MSVVSRGEAFGELFLAMTDNLSSKCFARTVVSCQSPITNYQLPITNYQLPITNHQSPITNHQSPITSIIYGNQSI